MSVPQPAGVSRGLLAFGALVAIWLPALHHLWQEWSVNEQYSYGFVVPLLAAYLFALRWEDRPDAGRRWPNGRVAAGLVAIAVLMLPLMLAAGANPDWRLLSWAMAALAIAAAILMAGRAGGWRWMSHFAFPVVFILVAVPWPMHFESAVIAWLMDSTAAIAADVLNLLAVPARQSGNVIEIGAASVGVDEACSGVRSLQTTLMTGLLLGEMYRFSKFGRLALVAGACLLAGVWNLGRTLTLVAITLKGGAELVNAWHDQVGWVVLAVSLGSVFVLARGLRTFFAEAPVSGRTRTMRAMPLLPRWLSCAVIGWMLLGSVAVEMWYRGGKEAAAEPRIGWTIRWPEGLPGMHEVPIPQQTWRLMKFSEGVNRVWGDEAGRRWSAFHLEWAPSRTAQALARLHSPEICLPAAGLHMIEGATVRKFQVRGLEIPFRHYLFEDADSPIHVYFLLQSVGAADGQMDKVEGLTWSNRLAAIRDRNRNAGQQQLEIGVWGCPDEQDANAAMQALLERLIVPGE